MITRARIAAGLTRRLRRHRRFSRSRLLREGAAVASSPRWREEGPDLAHLALYEQATWGPVARDEALLLHGLVRAMRPRTVVEIGFLEGDSALNFLCALDTDARLYSFDIDPVAVEYARERFGHDPRFTFRACSQEALTSGDIDDRPADLVFLDGAHDLALNQTTFERLAPLMAPDAILAVHDTGTISGPLTPADHWTRELTDRWAGDGFEHQPDERAFVNWVLETYPEYAQIHVHSHRTFRHGLTLLQRSVPLARPAGA